MDISTHLKRLLLCVFACRWTEQQAGRREHSQWGFWDRDESPLSRSAGPHRHQDGPLSRCVRRSLLTRLQVSWQPFANPPQRFFSSCCTDVTPRFSDLQLEPLQLRWGLSVQQPGPHPAGRSASPGYFCSTVPGRRGDRHPTSQPGVQWLRQVCRRNVFQRPGQFCEALDVFGSTDACPCHFLFFCFVCL